MSTEHVADAHTVYGMSWDIPHGVAVEIRHEKDKKLRTTWGRWLLVGQLSERCFARSNDLRALAMWAHDRHATEVRHSYDKADTL